jgi:hypothetical protein
MTRGRPLLVLDKKETLTPSRPSEEVNSVVVIVTGAES